MYVCLLVCLFCCFFFFVAFFIILVAAVFHLSLFCERFPVFCIDRYEWESRYNWDDLSRWGSQHMFTKGILTGSRVICGGLTQKKKKFQQNWNRLQVVLSSVFFFRYSGKFQFLLLEINSLFILYVQGEVYWKIRIS